MRGVTQPLLPVNLHAAAAGSAVTDKNVCFTLLRGLGDRLSLWLTKGAALPNSSRSERVNPAITSPSTEIPGIKPVARCGLGQMLVSRQVDHSTANGHRITEIFPPPGLGRLT